MGVDFGSTDAAFGLVPYQNIIHTSLYSVVTSVATQMAVGDMVETVGTAIVTAKFGTLQAAITEETGASGTILGAVLCLFDENMFPVNRIAASEAGDSTVAGYALVADDPNQEYLIQEDGDTSSIQVADIGLNCDLVSTSTPIAYNNYRSTMELDSNTIANTSTLAVHVLGVHPDDTISSAGAAGNYARFIVKLNAAYRGLEVTRT